MQAQPKTCRNCGESGAPAIPVSQEEMVHAVEELTPASQAGSQENTMAGAIGSCFNLGSVR